MTGALFIPDGKAGPFHALFPLRPIERLLFGGFTFEERWSLFPSARIDPARPVVANPLAVPDRSLAARIGAADEERIWTSGGRPVAARVDPERFARLAAGDGSWEDLLEDLTVEEGEWRLIGKPWDLISGNGRQIEEDLRLVEHLDPQTDRAPDTRSGPGFRSREALSIAGDGRLRIGDGAELGPFVHIDTTAGPVWIGERTVVEPHSTLRGPLRLRNDVRVKGGSRIGEGTTVGDGSRIAGEVEASLFGAFSNKQHDGFLGHAHVGEWVNLGAGTNNSDLKNNYGVVRLDWGEGSVETGEKKLGCFLGDHVKSAIGVRIGTGAVVGVASNLFGPAGLVSGFIPPFTWGEGGEVYDFDRAVDTMKVVRERRREELRRAGRSRSMEEGEFNKLRELWEKRIQGTA